MQSAVIIPLIALIVPIVLASAATPLVAVVLATVTSLVDFERRWWAYPDEYRQGIFRTFEALDARLGLVDPD